MKDRLSSLTIGHIFKGLILHVTASEQKFLLTAETMGIRKRGRNGRLKSISAGILQEFLHGNIQEKNQILTSADKEFMILWELDSMSVMSASIESIPGYPVVRLTQGQPICNLTKFCVASNSNNLRVVSVQAYLDQNLIIDYFPLHDEEDLNEFADDWIYSIVNEQPYGSCIPRYIKI